jgi:hypothetical protein
VVGETSARNLGTGVARKGRESKAKAVKTHRRSVIKLSMTSPNLSTYIRSLLFRASRICGSTSEIWACASTPLAGCVFAAASDVVECRDGLSLVTDADRDTRVVDEGRGLVKLEIALMLVILESDVVDAGDGEERRELDADDIESDGWLNFSFSAKQDGTGYEWAEDDSRLVRQSMKTLD